MYMINKVFDKREKKNEKMGNEVVRSGRRSVRRVKYPKLARPLSWGK